MLNAMFGLKFAVRAGRCTKGLFANLVKVDPTIQQETNYDYILVVDTEGLRSTELANIDHNNNDHDNELATLVIGIGDVTIINIMGENASDMQDTLQIVVHAFMKMDIVNIKPSCIFVHHNVTSAAASDMNTTQKRKLTEMLDAVTKCAAEEQKCIDRYQRFSDIIQFHENTDVMYVSSLWQGNPPIAPPNPGYSESIVKVKQKIIESMKMSHPKEVTAFKLRLSSVWKAIICEDFVFSFRNEIEIIAHNALETEYVKHSRTVRSNALTYSDMLQRECKHLKVENIDSVGNAMLVQKLTKLDESMTILRTAMEEYFLKERDAWQWKRRTEIKMDELYEGLRKELTNAFSTIKERIKSRAEKARIINMCETEILHKARDLVSELRNANLPEAHPKKIFDDEWKKWMAEIKTVSSSIVIENLELENVVRESCKSYDRTEITSILSTGTIHTQCLVDGNDVDLANARTSRFNFWPFKSDSRHIYLESANVMTAKIRQNLEKGISNHAKNGKTYSHEFGIHLFGLIQDELEVNTKKCNFKNNKTVIRVAVRIFWSLKPELIKLQEKYKRETDPRIYMENQKEKLWNVFKSECQMGEMVMKIACRVANELETAIKLSLPRHCITGVIEHMPTIQPFANKMSFHAQVLIDLAEKKDFKVFLSYLKNPFECMKLYIKLYIENTCSKISNGKTVFKKIYCEKLQEIFIKVNRAVEATCQQSSKQNLNAWWSEFSMNVSSDLIVSKQLMYLNDYSDFDVGDFKEKLLSELMSSKDELEKAFSKFDNFAEIVDQCQRFFEKDLLGCQELCPFCKAPCDLQTMNDEHRTAYHRPQGVKGYIDHKTKKLDIELCTTNVASDRRFKCKDTDGEWKPCEDYQEVNDRYRAWKIQPMVGEPQLYWKWFMKTYNKQLAEYYKVKPSDIPEGWNDISWESAKKDMRRTYNL